MRHEGGGGTSCWFIRMGLPVRKKRVQACLEVVRCERAGRAERASVIATERADALLIAIEAADALGLRRGGPNGKTFQQPAPAAS